MRPGLSGHGAGIPRRHHGPGHAAHTPRDLAQGHDLGQPVQDRAGGKTRLPGGAPADARTHPAATAGHPALGPEPFRGAQGDLGQAHHHPRPRLGRASADARGVVEPIYRGRTGAVARSRLHPARGEDAHLAVPTDRSDHGLLGVAVPCAAVVGGAAGLRADRATFPAVDRRPGGGVQGRRPAHHTGAGLPCWCCSCNRALACCARGCCW